MFLIVSLYHVLVNLEHTAGKLVESLASTPENIQPKTLELLEFFPNTLKLACYLKNLHHLIPMVDDFLGLHIEIRSIKKKKEDIQAEIKRLSKSKPDAETIEHIKLIKINLKTFENEEELLNTQLFGLHKLYDDKGGVFFRHRDVGVDDLPQIPLTTETYAYHYLRYFPDYVEECSVFELKMLKLKDEFKLLDEINQKLGYV